MNEPPHPNLHRTLASFTETWSPTTLATVNDYDVRVAHVRGDHVWHVHEGTDELFLVVDGNLDIAVREGDGAETTVALAAGDVYVVPRGVEHRPSSTGGSILLVEPSGTSSTGDDRDGGTPG